MNNIFITGGMGFVGTHLVHHLTDKGYNVTVLARDHKPKSYFYSLRLNHRTNIVKGDLMNGRLLTRTLNEYEIDTVFHLGAQSIISAGNKSPIGTFETNIKGTWELLDACRICDTERVVVASSDKAYGSHDTLPYSEHMTLKGEHPYDVSKSCMDLISQSYYKTYGLPVSITRCANIYGGGDYNFSRLIPKLIRSSFTGEKVTIRGSGLMERDFLFVGDAILAYEKLANNKNGIGESFNFGCGKPIKIIDVVCALQEVMQNELNIEVINDAKNEISKQYLDSQKAKEILNWSPAVDLKTGLDLTYLSYLETKYNFLNDENLNKELLNKGKNEKQNNYTNLYE